MIEKFTPEELEQIKRELSWRRERMPRNLFMDLDSKFCKDVLIGLPDVTLVREKGDLINQYTSKHDVEEIAVDRYECGKMGNFAIESVHRLIKISFRCYVRGDQNNENWIFKREANMLDDISEARDMYIEIMNVVKKHFRPYKEEN